MLKFYKEIVASVDHAGLYQSTALVLFMLFFVSVIAIVLSRPKNYYKDQDHLPLED